MEFFKVIQFNQGCSTFIHANELAKNQVNLLVHELEPKKCVFGSGGWTKHNIDF